MNEASCTPIGIEMAFRLRRACEAHDPSIGAHLDRVRHYACKIGGLLGCPEERLSELFHATPLHDVGKIGISLALLSKPGRLTSDEMAIIKTHTTIGHRILQSSNLPIIKCAAQIALSHHECWDGSGYPHGLGGLQIPLEARIVAIADVYDAMLSQRSYKEAWPEERVLNEMRALRGKNFDPELLDLFLDHLPPTMAPDPASVNPPSKSQAVTVFD